MNGILEFISNGEVPSILTLACGKEHNVLVQGRDGSGFIYGKVLLVQQACLHAVDQESNQLSLQIDSIANMHKIEADCHSRKCPIYVNQRFLVRAKTAICVREEELAVVEQFPLPYFESPPISEDGTQIAVDLLLEKIPALRKYHLGNGVFGLLDKRLSFPSIDNLPDTIKFIRTPTKEQNE